MCDGLATQSALHTGFNTSDSYIGIYLFNIVVVMESSWYIYKHTALVLLVVGEIVNF